MRILLVEDDDNIREVLKMVLEAEAPFRDLVVDAARNGTEALDYVRAAKPDLVLLDLTLPEGHGFEIFKRLRSAKECWALPVIAVTAHSLKHLETEALALGFAGYVTKPIDFDETLFPLIARILSGATEHDHAA